MTPTKATYNDYVGSYTEKNQPSRRRTPSECAGEGRSAAEIDECIRQTRREMDETLQALEHKLAPGKLYDQGMDYLRSNYGSQMEWITDLPRQVKANPVSFIIAGVGMLLGGAGLTAYAMTKRRKSAARHDEQSLIETGTPVQLPIEEPIHAEAAAIHPQPAPGSYEEVPEQQASTEEIIHGQSEEEKEDTSPPRMG